MAQKFHIKRGDQVVVIAGSQKGKSGKVLELLSVKQLAFVECFSMNTRNTKKSQENPNGSIVEREGSVHISNLMKQADFDGSKRKKNA